MAPLRTELRGLRSESQCLALSSLLSALSPFSQSSVLITHPSVLYFLHPTPYTLSSPLPSALCFLLAAFCLLPAAICSLPSVLDFLYILHPFFKSAFCQLLPASCLLRYALCALLFALYLRYPETRTSLPNLLISTSLIFLQPLIFSIPRAPIMRLPSPPMILGA